MMLADKYRPRTLAQLGRKLKAWTVNRSKPTCALWKEHPSFRDALECIERGEMLKG